MRTLSALSAAVALVSAASVAGAAQFTISNLGGLGGSSGSRAYGISELDVIAATGWTAGNGTYGGFSSVDNGGGVVTNTPYTSGLGSVGSYAFGAAGSTVVGYDVVRNSHAMSGNGGVFTDLHTTRLTVGGSPLAAATNSRAFGINDGGAVVGQAQLGNWQAFYLPNVGMPTAIPQLAGGAYLNGLATSVDADGAVVGFDYNGSWSYGGLSKTLAGGTTDAMAFLWTGGVPTALGTLGGNSSVAFGVATASGVRTIVGQSTVGVADMLDTKGHAFEYANGTMTRLPEPSGATYSVADDVNASGDVVGAVSTAAGKRAYLWRNGSAIDLNSMLDSSLIGPTKWTLLEADAINDDGFIAGYGTYNGQTTSFLLLPTGAALVAPEPATIGIVTAAGVILLAGRRRGA